MRIRLIKTFFLFFLFAIILRLAYWQIIKADFLQAQAENQHFVDTKIEAMRGNIFFSDGSILASSNPSFTLYGLPKVIKPDEKVEDSYLLSKVLSASSQDVDVLAKDIVNKLSQDLFWVKIADDLPVEQKKQIESLNISGIGFEEGRNRFYPEGSSSAHLLGFVGNDEKGLKKGYFGLEGFYDRELKGIPGISRNEKDAMGIPILIGNFFTSEAKKGKDLVLSIDRVVQFIAEEKLKAGIEKYGAKAGSVVIMDPKTGQVIAMASYPNYDPLNYFKFPKEYFKNPVVADQYEPGSTFKVLVMAAAINEDMVKPDTKCDICSEPVSVGGYDIRTWDNKYRPQSSMKDVIVHSDNTGMVFTGRTPILRSL